MKTSSLTLELSVTVLEQRSRVGAYMTRPIVKRESDPAMMPDRGVGARVGVGHTKGVGVALAVSDCIVLGHSARRAS